MKTTIVGKATIAEGQRGPIRWAIEAHGAALGLFSARERNNLVRDALESGGKFYVAVFVPMNFTDYAKRKGWAVSAKYQQRKDRMVQRGQVDGPADPLVYLGILREAAVKRSTVTATATANKAGIQIHIPIPPHGNGKGKYGISPIVGAVLRSIMPWEIERVGEVVEKALVAGLTGAMEQRFNPPDVPPARSIPVGTPRAKAPTGRARRTA